MKKIFRYMLGLAMIVGFTSCESWLDIDPRQSITPELALEDVSGYEALVYAAYNANIGFGYFGQNQMIAPDVLADNLVLANNTGRYVGESVNAVGSHMGRWGLYGTINLCNIIIAADLPDLAAADQATLDRVKGEAYFIRALNYHDLHKVYSYEPGQEVNGFNAGVILRTTPTNSVSDADLRTRSTVQEGYDLMVADLEMAISLLPAEADNGDFPYRASKAAAQMLLAKVQLYQGNFAAAATAADAAIAGTSAGLVDAAGYEASWSAQPHPESVFELDIRSNDWSGVDGINNSLASMTTTGLFPNSQFVVAGSAELLSSFEPGDVRRDLWIDEDGSGRFQARKWVGEEGDFLENLPIMRYSELLLIAAEAKAKSGNEAGARTHINDLRANRGLAAINSSGAGLLNVIMNERRVELCVEGHRWFDLKRQGMDIPKPAINQESLVPYADFRLLSRIPVNQVILNENLEQNPGYETE